jgi:hypothetical protein
MVKANLGNLGFGRNTNATGGNDECFTPPEIFQALSIRFDLDVAAPEGGIPWIPCHNYYTKQDDALSREWSGRVWMNPPFSLVSKFAPRFQQHRNGIALLPTSTGKWMHELWNDPESTWLRLNKVRFIKPDGVQYERYMPSVIWLVAYGQESVEALSRIGKVKR